MVKWQPVTASGSENLVPLTRAYAPVEPPLTRSLLAVAITMEVFLLGLVAVAPLGGVSQTISPLAQNGHGCSLLHA